jgi:hypothetical protein
MAGAYGPCRCAADFVWFDKSRCQDNGPYVRWYAVCKAWGMLNMLTTPAFTLVFLIVVVGLGTAFVWMFWEIESRRRRPGQ